MFHTDNDLAGREKCPIKVYFRMFGMRLRDLKVNPDIAAAVAYRCCYCTDNILSGHLPPLPFTIHRILHQDAKWIQLEWTRTSSLVDFRPLLGFHERHNISAFVLLTPPLLWLLFLTYIFHILCVLKIFTLWHSKKNKKKTLTFFSCGSRSSRAHKMKVESE